MSANLRLVRSDDAGMDHRRFIPLRFASGWVVWDRLHGRVSDGVYFDESDARDTADAANSDPQHFDRDWFAETYWKADGKRWEPGNE